MTLARSIVAAWRAADRTSPPNDVIEAARLHMLDAIGVGLAASALEQGEPYRRIVTSRDGVAATLTGARAHDAAEAALVNGGLIHSLEYDDTHTASIVHGSSVLAPVALAVAEAEGRSLDEAAGVYLLGYETLIRIGLAAPGAFQSRGFQITPVGGAMIAALMAARLMRGGDDVQVNAMGIALSQASGVFEFLSNGSTVKSLHPGWAAHAGIYAARLARAGMTGPETSLEGRRGLFASFAGDEAAAGRLGASMADFGRRWYMTDVAFKFVPCCHYLHPFVEAAGKLAEAGVRAESVAEAVLRIAPGAAGIVCEPWAEKLAPPDGHAIRWSLPVVVAARLVSGRVDHTTFATAPSASVLALARKCRWEPLEPNRFPQAFEAEIDVKLTDGRIERARVDDVFGNASRPAPRGAVIAKFHANAGLCLSSDTSAAIERTLLHGGQPMQTFADAVTHRETR